MMHAEPALGIPKIGTKRAMNLAHFVRQAARRYEREIGLVWKDDSWTWGALAARIESMASALSELGVGKGDRVLVVSTNCNQLFESMYACFWIGAVWVPANFRQTPDEIVKLSQVTDASAMICHKSFGDHAAAVCRANKYIRFVISIEPSDTGPDYEGLVQEYHGRRIPMATVEYDDPCWFFLTSGSSGQPKAAILTHGQMAFVITNHLCDLMPTTAATTDASLVVAPLSHGAGIHQLAQVARGVKTVLLSNHQLSAVEVWALVSRWRVTNMFTVPTILKILTEHPSVDEYDHSSLRYVVYAGAPMYREDQKRALNKLGKVLVQYFGLGEVTGCITVLPPELHDSENGPGVKLGTCGYERTGMQISIRNASGDESPAKEIGEIWVCGIGVFAGYYNNTEANEKAFFDGWFRTGDVGYVDDEGFLYITGRTSDMYISGGSNIYPREIEEKLLLHPAVSEIAILGVPDRKWGEVGVGVCVLQPNKAVDEAELVEWMRQHVASYKIPKRIFFWDALPKSAYGKITKNAVRAELEARGCLPLGRVS
jgi:acyl-CoA synthetase (AMP-forming)/AMP-acid ligase II